MFVNLLPKCVLLRLSRWMQFCLNCLLRHMHIHERSVCVLPVSHSGAWSTATFQRKDKSPRFSSSSITTTSLLPAMKLLISSHISQNLSSASHSRLLHALLYTRLMHLSIYKFSALTQFFSYFVSMRYTALPNGLLPLRIRTLKRCWVNMLQTPSLDPHSRYLQLGCVNQTNRHGCLCSTVGSQ